MNKLKSLVEPLVREIPDFPTPGVLFRDLTRLFADPTGFR
ncbi:MAG: adenine phosphoribosyltransferase, partial [Actinomycetota bacterium]|nr:adenine phosphoribosyltransferase [Actinomycetota bacterium]